MRILVTGAAGFVGSHLSKRLEDEGHKLKLVDNFSRGKMSYLKHLEVETKCFYGELKDYKTALNFTKGVDTVFHTAAVIGGEQFLHGSPSQELHALWENTMLDQSVFKACMENDVSNIIFTSSVSVYDINIQKSKMAKLAPVVFYENDFKSMPFHPDGGYGLAKALAEKQLEYMSKNGMKVGIARIFKAYGPCDDYSDESGQVVCSLMRKAIKHPKEPFVVWGNGKAKRCYLYIDDLIDALIRIFEYGESITVNVGEFKETSVKKLAEKIISLSGKEIKIEFDKSKKGTPLSRVPDIGLAVSKMNWKPTVKLDDGLKKTYDWMLKDLKC